MFLYVYRRTTNDNDDDDDDDDAKCGGVYTPYAQYLLHKLHILNRFGMIVNYMPTQRTP